MQVPGKDVTWTWDPLPAGMSQAMVYYLSIKQSVGGIVLSRSDVVKAPRRPPAYVMTPATLMGPPFTISAPSGSSVELCVSPFDITSIVASGGQLPNGTSCLQTQVP